MGVHVKHQVASALGVATLALQTSSGLASIQTSTPTRTSTTWKRVEGPVVAVDRWGVLQVALIVKKTTTKTKTRTRVVRRITAVRLPIYPRSGAPHTVGLNRKVLPVLVQQVFAGQLTTQIQYISEATDTSVAFETSLQAALLKARRV